LLDQKNRFVDHKYLEKSRFVDQKGLDCLNKQSGFVDQKVMDCLKTNPDLLINKSWIA